MDIDITLKNYRRFEKPVRITLRKGFTSFIGVNDSGKSSILRSFYELRSIYQNLGIAGDFSEERGQSFSIPFSLFDYEEMFCNINKRDIDLQIEFETSSPEQNGTFRFDIVLHRNRACWNSTQHLNDQIIGGKQGRIRFNYSEDKLDTIGKALETLKSILSNTMYVGAYRNILSVGSQVDYFDIKIGAPFIEQSNSLKLGNSKAHQAIVRKVEEDIGKIFGYSRVEINSCNANQTLQVSINNKSFKLPELGAGIAQFILVLASAAIKRPSYILIDEPELNLHPALQSQFLTALGSYATEGTLFATHNIGLAHAISERIYSVVRKDHLSEIVPYEATPQLAEFLGEMSFSGYRELGFDQILLVEGPSELKAIQQMLRFYNLADKVVLIHLGGGNSINGASDIQLQEVKRLSNNVCALIDSEKEEPNAELLDTREQFRMRCSANRIRCKVLDRRAIENYFTQRAIDRAFGKDYRKLGPYESLKDRKCKAWAKKDNWKIARETTIHELNSTDLGKFLKSLKGQSAKRKVR